MLDDTYTLNIIIIIPSKFSIDNRIKKNKNKNCIGLEGIIWRFLASRFLASPHLGGINANGMKYDSPGTKADLH